MAHPAPDRDRPPAAQLPSGGGTLRGSGILTVSILLFVFAMNLLWENAEGSPGIDYYQVWVAAEAVRNKTVADIYAAGADAALGDRYLLAYRRTAPSERQRAVATKCRELGLTGTPFLYAALSPAVTGDYERDYRVFQAISIACLAASIAIFGRLLGLSTPAWLAMGGLLAGWFAPILSDTLVGNVNRIQLALLAVAAWLLSRGHRSAATLAGGALLSCAVFFKPNVGLAAGLLGVWWIMGGQFGRLAWAGAGALIGAIVAVSWSAASFGTLRCWASWFDMISHLRDRYQPTSEMGNFGLSEYLRGALGRDVSTYLLVGLLALAGAAFWVARVRGRAGAGGAEPATGRAGNAEVLVIGLGCAAWLLSAWLVWLHYYVLLTPLILLAASPAPGGRNGRQRPVGWFRRGVLIFALVAWNQVLLESFVPISLHRWAGLSILAAGLLAGLGMGELLRRGAGPGNARPIDIRQGGG